MTDEPREQDPGGQPSERPDDAAEPREGDAEREDPTFFGFLLGFLSRPPAAAPPRRNDV